MLHVLCYDRINAYNTETQWKSERGMCACVHLVCGSGKIATICMRLEKHIDEIGLSEQIKSIVFAVACYSRAYRYSIDWAPPKTNHELFGDLAV